jgi:hypothetical protein
VGELGAGDHRVDARVELDLLQRFALIPQGNDRIAARLEQARDDQTCRAAGIDECDAHRLVAPPVYSTKALSDIPLKLF